MQINGMAVSRETWDRLEHFIALFNKWARSINLVAPSTLPDLRTRHVADSAQIYQLSPGPLTWLDLGSGGGFPGIITAILLTETEGGWVHLVESNQKKAAFLRQALLETGGRGSVHPCRIDEALSHIGRVDRISARALAHLDVLLSYAEPWMQQNAQCKAFFHKGRDYQQETMNANGRWAFDLVEHPSVVEPDSVVLEIAGLRRKVN
ncbi:16S rRNA (guanine(527)-N(7))-methyltransferase RsmG [Neorhizobium sp. NPDC001467]|uniref:16S rRNA (guanine(527)-N(7))-methyltransferase RsmG n=1 Tax=Neorhizobium sp. NPDC001467 TaxID=3390595 RepID=UPI003D005D21